MGLKKQKAPRRTIYFASGETMEEYNTDEEEEEPEKTDVVATVDPVSPFCVCYCCSHTVTVTFY